MNRKNKILQSISQWSNVEKVLRVIEVLAVVSISLVVIQIPAQFRMWEEIQGDHSGEVLIRLDSKLKQGTNCRIFNAIRKNRPILKENGGRFERYELGYYLDDLGLVYEACAKKRIDDNAARDWFGDYLAKTFDNEEVQVYLQKIEKDDPDYYKEFRDFVRRITE